MGALFTLSRSSKAKLDRVEGLGNGYEEKMVSVVTPEGKRTQAVTYYATHISDALLPYCWYHHHVLTGARDFELPADYIQSIADVRFATDNDVERRTQEMSIY